MVMNRVSFTKRNIDSDLTTAMEISDDERDFQEDKTEYFRRKEEEEAERAKMRRKAGA